MIHIGMQTSILQWFVAHHGEWSCNVLQTIVILKISYDLPIKNLFLPTRAVPVILRRIHQPYSLVPVTGIVLWLTCNLVPWARGICMPIHPTKRSFPLAYSLCEKSIHQSLSFLSSPLPVRKVLAAFLMSFIRANLAPFYVLHLIFPSVWPSLKTGQCL